MYMYIEMEWVRRTPRDGRDENTSEWAESPATRSKWVRGHEVPYIHTSYAHDKHPFFSRGTRHGVHVEEG